MSPSLLIFFGAGLGGLCRYWVSHAVHSLMSKQFPYGTMVVNVSGCFLMGLLFVLTTERWDGNSSSFRALLMIGLMGGYTTFSSFSIESLLLLENGRWLSALCNVLGTTTLCLTATWIGVIGGRSI